MEALVGERTWNSSATLIGPDELDVIKAVVNEYPGLSREELGSSDDVVVEILVCRESQHRTLVAPRRGRH